MAFPASGGATFPYTLETAWSGSRQTALQIQQQSNTLNAQISAGSVSGQVIVNSNVFFAALNAQLTTYAATPGLAAYAQQQVNNPSLDVTAAFNTMQSALVAVITWIVTNFPKDGGGNLLYTQFNGSGQQVFTFFTAGQLSGLVPLLSALSATIN